MKAIVYHRYGAPDGVALEEIERPAAGEGQVLVRVHAASVNPLDWHRMRGLPYFLRATEGLRKPKNTGLGADFAGTVEAVGAGVTNVHPGDEVVGMGIRALAEFVVVKAEGVVPKPAGLTFEQAAAVPVAALTALQGLRKGRIAAGQSVLVNGAAGGVGSFGVQIAKSFGAEVTGVCSTRNVELVRSLGAEHVIDYTAADFTQGGEQYDLILDAVGNRSLSESARALKPHGILVMVAAPNSRWFGAIVYLLNGVARSWFGGRKFVPILAKRTNDDLLALTELLETGKMAAVIDRSYPLSEAPDALEYLEQGHARGKVVVTV
jgi:NADPH:quinone reductase-like Zn-dependent oxidoreductase